MKFCEPNSGDINLYSKPTSNGNGIKIDLGNLSQKAWCANIRAVMQEGFVLNDTIANNIAVGVDSIDKKKLIYAADVANS
ncbi:MAG TPA: hypothetical protein VFS71_14100 [Flavobacterium sp.]|nr:hypothetical protein [Flavobacterium sp.]HEU4790814.1 hypothetical protein [Flavobacterium sp.]